MTMTRRSAVLAAGVVIVSASDAFFASRQTGSARDEGARGRHLSDRNPMRLTGQCVGSRDETISLSDTHRKRSLAPGMSTADVRRGNMESEVIDW